MERVPGHGVLVQPRLPPSLARMTARSGWPLDHCATAWRKAWRGGHARAALTLSASISTISQGVVSTGSQLAAAAQLSAFASPRGERRRSCRYAASAQQAVSTSEGATTPEAMSGDVVDSVVIYAICFVGGALKTVCTKPCDLSASNDCEY